MLFVYTWLLDNRTFLLIVKAALQVQFCNPVQMHPTWSLSFLVVFLLCLNLLLALAHLWAPSSQTNHGDAIFIDFVGQINLPNRFHMLLIDAFVCFVQLLMNVVAFEIGKDQVKPDDEPSALDDLTSRLDEEDLGQGFDVRDEEATLFGLDEEQERKRERTSLTHHIAVVRFRPIFDQILSREFLPVQSSPEADAEVEVSSHDPHSQHHHLHQQTQAQALTADPNSDRPDTSRIRRFSRRRPRTGLQQAAAGVSGPPAYTGLGPVSADDSWPPMWLIIARNLAGNQQAPPSPSPTATATRRLASFSPSLGFATLRDTLTTRFGRNLTTTPTPTITNHGNGGVDRSQYTRINASADDSSEH